LQYYKSTALTNSQVIITQALKSYNNKEISYVDYLTVVTNALNIESDYLNVIYQNDLAVLKMQYLLAK
jgi:cobalt-zinc-cadmium resistance protein CzcA